MPAFVRKVAKVGAGGPPVEYSANMHRVLVVYSWDDDISQMRYERMAAIAPKAGIAFEQCFAVARPAATVKAAALFKRIATAIDRFKPEILLIHTGAAFRSAPGEFAHCLQRVHDTYPTLWLGYERRYAPPLLAELNIFDNSAPTQHAERVFFS